MEQPKELALVHFLCPKWYEIELLQSEVLGVEEIDGIPHTRGAFIFLQRRLVPERLQEWDRGVLASQLVAGSGA